MQITNLLYNKLESLTDVPSICTLSFCVKQIIVLYKKDWSRVCGEYSENKDQVSVQGQIWSRSRTRTNVLNNVEMEQFSCEGVVLQKHRGCEENEPEQCKLSLSHKGHLISVSAL